MRIVISTILTISLFTMVGGYIVISSGVELFSSPDLSPEVITTETHSQSILRLQSLNANSRKIGVQLAGLSQRQKDLTAIISSVSPNPLDVDSRLVALKPVESIADPGVSAYQVSKFSKKSETRVSPRVLSAFVEETGIPSHQIESLMQR